MKYYVNENQQENGDHEVHTADCRYLPERENRIYLGEYESCRLAVLKAKSLGYKANGCIHCCRLCHTS